MLKHLAIRNYQSIKKADLDLAPVTLIVGQNFAGKSTVLRTLRALAFNQSGDEFIRHGEKSAYVELGIETGEGELTTVGWEKPRGKSATYGLLDQTFTKTRSGVPEQVADLLGIREIPIDKAFSISPQFQMQWDAPLIVGDSGSRVARILGKLTRLDVVVTAQMLCRKDKDAASREASTAEEEAGRLQQQLDGLGDVAALREGINLVTRSVDLAGQRAQEIELLLDVVGRSERASVISQQAGHVQDLRTQLENARSAQESLFSAHEAVRRYKGADGAVEASGTAHSMAVDAHENALKAHEEVCKGAGLCEECPFR